MHKEETGGERPHSVSEGMAVLTCSQTLACTHSGFHGNMCMKVSRCRSHLSKTGGKPSSSPVGCRYLDTRTDTSTMKTVRQTELPKRSVDRQPCPGCSRLGVCWQMDCASSNCLHETGPIPVTSDRQSQYGHHLSMALLYPTLPFPFLFLKPTKLYLPLDLCTCPGLSAVHCPYVPWLPLLDPQSQLQCHLLWSPQWLHCSSDHC